MTMLEMPGFFYDPHFHPDPNNWHVDDDAPEWVKKEFEEYMKETEEHESQGIFI